jgi:RNA polymerase sigma factor (sigma-70 family)
VGIDSRNETRRPDGATAEALIRSCLEDRAGAWEAFLSRFSGLIYSAVAKYSLPEEEKREAYQATCVAIAERLGELRDPDRLHAWIIGIAVRQSANRLHRILRESPSGQIEDDALRTGRDPRLPDPLPDEELLALERAQQAAEALNALSERCQRLLSALFFEVPSPEYQAIADREGLSLGSIGPLRARCLDRVRSYFVERRWA